MGSLATKRSNDHGAKGLETENIGAVRSRPRAGLFGTSAKHFAMLPCSALLSFESYSCGLVGNVVFLRERARGRQALLKPRE
jgi:hypothetical protein